MGACKSCSRVVLVLINILFSVIGLAMLIVGCVVRWGTDIMNRYLADVYKEFQKTLPDASLEDFDIADLLRDVTLSFIVIGAFFFVIGILGCVGACCTVRPMLIVYVIILTILVLAEVAFVVVLFAAKSQVDKWLKVPFSKTIEKYRGIDGKDAVTLGLNFIMTKFECCGVDGSEDFNASSTWNRTFVDSNKENNTKVIPAVCCKNITDEVCFLSPNRNNSYMDQGCYSAMKDWLNDNLAPLIGTSAAVLGIELVLVALACVACAKGRKDDDNESYDKPVMDDRSYDQIRAYDQQGYHGPHNNRPPHRGGPPDNRPPHRGGPHDNRQPYREYRGGPNDNRGYQRSDYDYPRNDRRDRHY